MGNQIQPITRRNIFDFIQAEGIRWAGRLEEINFLNRIFDLEQMESYDHRFPNAASDIWQHRINNPSDWPDDWIFNDKRFDLVHGDDSAFLNFICEMVHPLVRPDSTEVAKMTQLYNDALAEDNFEVVEKSKLGGKPIFAGRLKITGRDSIVQKGREIKLFMSEEYVSQQINLMESSIDNAPHIAIGIAKELIETCCKSILEERGIACDKAWDLPRLMKETTKRLKLTPEDIPNEVRAAASIKQILGSLSSVVQGIAEVRNEYGSGHGKNGKFRGLQPRHAKLAVGAASTLAIYLLETNRIKED